MLTLNGIPPVTGLCIIDISAGTLPLLKVWIDGHVMNPPSTLYFWLLYTTDGVLSASNFKAIFTPLFIALIEVSGYLKLYEHFKSHFPFVFCGDITALI